MAQPRFELISFTTCPYVQRSRITLLHKGVEHDVTYIDLADPPAWFAEVSPLGKVPVLRVHDGETTTDVFESAVINEYLDSVTGGGMLPDEPLARAVDRAWIEFASELNGLSYGMLNAKDKAAFESGRDRIVQLLDTLEARLGAGPFWGGDDLGLVDTSFAPFLQRALLLAPDVTLFTEGSHPKVWAWAQALVAQSAVTDSVTSELGELYRGYIAAGGGYLSGIVASA